MRRAVAVFALAVVTAFFAGGAFAEDPCPACTAAEKAAQEQKVVASPLCKSCKGASCETCTALLKGVACVPCTVRMRLAVFCSPKCQASGQPDAKCGEKRVAFFRTGCDACAKSLTVKDVTVKVWRCGPFLTDDGLLTVPGFYTLRVVYTNESKEKKHSVAGKVKFRKGEVDIMTTTLFSELDAGARVEKLHQVMLSDKSDAKLKDFDDFALTFEVL